MNQSISQYLYSQRSAKRKRSEAKKTTSNIKCSHTAFFTEWLLKQNVNTYFCLSYD